MGRKKIDCGPPVELSGPYILNHIRNRCAICPECGEKTHWLGSQNESGIYPLRIGRRQVSVRRVVFELNGGKLNPLGKLITDCENHRCINPKKLRQVTMKHIVREAAKAGKIMTLPTRAKIAAVKRATQGKISQEDAKLIRLDTRPSPAIAAEYGLSDTHVRAIKSGKARREYSSSPFQGLGAR